MRVAWSRTDGGPLGWCEARRAAQVERGQSDRRSKEQRTEIKEQDRQDLIVNVCEAKTTDGIQAGGKLASNQQLESVQQAAATITQSVTGKLEYNKIEKKMEEEEGGKLRGGTIRIS